MKYFIITFYCYKLEENELLITLHKKDSTYFLTKTYNTDSLDSYCPEYIKEYTFIYYIDMLNHIMHTFDEFYKDHITYMPYSVNVMPPDYYIINICGLSIDRYIERKNEANIKMENSILLYNCIIEDIKSKLNKAIFRLLTIKIAAENIQSLQALCIAGDAIVKFL